MKKIKEISIYKMVFIIILKLLILGCSDSSNSRKSIKVKGKLYKSILLFNEKDTIDGYYRVEKDSLFYLSHWDYVNYDSISCDKIEYKENLSGYFWFSLDMKEPYSSNKKKCELHPKYGIFNEGDDLRNIFYPPELIGDSIYIIKQVARIYDTSDISIRNFIVDKEMKILSFETLSKNNKSYFFYD